MVILDIRILKNIFKKTSIKLANSKFNDIY